MNFAMKASPMSSEANSSSTEGSIISVLPAIGVRPVCVCPTVVPGWGEAISARQSSSLAADTGLAMNVRAPASSQRWIESGVTSALSTITGVCRAVPASITLS